MTTSGSLPTMEVSDPQLGNLGDFGKSGSLHEFLVAQHKAMGNAFGFAWGNQPVVSLCHQLWKHISKLFDRPVVLFAVFMSMIGEDSIQYANGADGKERRRSYVNPSFSSKANKIHVRYLSLLVERMKQNWIDRITESSDTSLTLDLSDEMMMYALRAIALTSLGGDLPEETVMALQISFDIAWEEMDRRLTGDLPRCGTRQGLCRSTACHARDCQCASQRNQD